MRLARRPLRRRRVRRLRTSPRLHLPHGDAPPLAELPRRRHRHPHQQPPSRHARHVVERHRHIPAGPPRPRARARHHRLARNRLHPPALPRSHNLPFRLRGLRRKAGCLPRAAARRRRPAPRHASPARPRPRAVPAARHPSRPHAGNGLRRNRRPAPRPTRHEPYRRPRPLRRPRARRNRGSPLRESRHRAFASFQSHAGRVASLPNSPSHRRPRRRIHLRRSLPPRPARRGMELRHLMDGERSICDFPTAKRPRDTVWPLAKQPC